jgi:hypothetical protein
LKRKKINHQEHDVLEEPALGKILARKGNAFEASPACELSLTTRSLRAGGLVEANASIGVQHVRGSTRCRGDRRGG